MERIKRFYREHENEILSSLLVVTGVGCAIGGVIALREMNRADGMQIEGVKHFVDQDGIERVHVYLANGTARGFHKITD